MSQDFLVAGRKAVLAIDEYHEASSGEARRVSSVRVATFTGEADLNRANEWDKEAVQFLKNYKVAIWYVHIMDDASDTSEPLSPDMLKGVPPDELLKYHQEILRTQQADAKFVKFCMDHGCKQLYEVCKEEAKMFDTGIVPRNSRCRNIADEDVASLLKAVL